MHMFLYNKDVGTYTNNHTNIYKDNLKVNIKNVNNIYS